MLPFSLSRYRLQETAEPIENTAFQAFFGVKLPSYHTFSHIEENIFLTFTYFFLLYKGEFCPVTWVTGNFYLNGSSSCSHLSIVSTGSNPSLSMLSFSRRNTHLIGLPFSTGLHASLDSARTTHLPDFSHLVHVPPGSQAVCLHQSL